MKEKNTILCVSHHGSPKTGGHSRFDRLVMGLANSGKNVIWISPCRSESFCNRNISFIGKNNKGYFGKKYAHFRLLLFAIRHVKALVKIRENISYVVAFGETNLFAAIFISKLLHVPISIGVRSNLTKRLHIILAEKKGIKKFAFGIRNKGYIYLLKKMYPLVDQIVVQTSNSKAEFSQSFSISQDKILVVENNVPLISDSTFPPRPIAIQPRKMLFVGNASPIKGLDVLLSAIPKLSSKVSAINEITIVGVQEDFLMNATQGLSTDIRITIIPWCSDVLNLMQSYDLLVVPSREDQFPNVVLEALAVGLPVIGSAVDGIRYILDDDWVLFSPGDGFDLVRCLQRVSTRDGYAKASSIAKTRLKKFSFDWEKEYIATLANVEEGSSELFKSDQTRTLRHKSAHHS